METTNLKLKISGPAHDKGNTFMGYSTPILNCEDAQIILDAICTKQALNLALHYVCLSLSKAVSVDAKKCDEFYEDDCEWGTGRILLEALQQTKLMATWLMLEDEWDWIRFTSVQSDSNIISPV